MPRAVQVTQITDELSDPDDINDRPAGDNELGASQIYWPPAHLVNEPDDELILDWFHDTVPIGGLEDFEITVIDRRLAQCQQFEFVFQAPVSKHSRPNVSRFFIRERRRDGSVIAEIAFGNWLGRFEEVPGASYQVRMTDMYSTDGRKVPGKVATGWVIWQGDATDDGYEALSGPMDSFMQGTS